MHESTRTIGNVIGFTLSRIVVPLWVLAGASFKLYERTPSNLPSVILKTGKDMQLDLDLLLRLLIGLEFFAVGVMFLVPRLARSMAIFMLSSFVLILLGEMYRQATKCGCFGSITIKPWQMLLIDGTLLLGVIAFRPTPKAGSTPVEGDKNGWTKSFVAATVLAVAGLAVAFAVPDRPATEQIVQNDQRSTNTQTDPANGTQPEVPADPQVNPSPAPVPNSWYVRTSVQEEWVGKPWREIDLFKFLQRWPKDLDQGKHYVVFYSRTCEHCQTMFQEHFAMGLDAPVAAVQIPNKRDVMTDEAAWDLPLIASTVELYELPLGCNYIITPPLALTIVDGRITCAVEGEGFETCLGVK